MAKKFPLRCQIHGLGATCRIVFGPRHKCTFKIDTLKGGKGMTGMAHCG